MLLGAGLVQAQVTFFEDFESYIDGDLIAATNPSWTTWSNAPGSAEDAPVSTEQAYSGVNSLKLYSSSSSGGPDDVVLPFGGKYDVGTFHFEMYMFVVAGTGAYFNFQAEEEIGTQWSFQLYFTPDGAIDVQGDGGAQLPIDGTFPPGEWFKVSVQIDLTNNVWELFINDVSQGSFANSANAVASLDIFPVYENGTSQFYVDDVYFEYLPPVLPDIDAKMNAISVKPGVLTGTEVVISGQIRNTGNNTLNSFDISWSDGVNEHTDNFTGLNIPSLEYYDFIHSSTLTVADGTSDLSVWVSNPNADVDGNPENDTLVATVTGYTPAPDKMVVVEEGTGTWCGWCPRGAVFMDLMYATYPDLFIPIAVHNGDPMTVEEYDDNLGISAFPNMVIMRDETFGFGVVEHIESRFFERIIQSPPATLLSGGVYDEETGDLTITAKAEFLSNLSGDHRLAVILVEDGVTGTTTSYAQANYYAGGAQGPMGGYESLPNPVPAAQMVYDHVGRILVGGFFGADGSVPSSVTAGEEAVYTFEPVNIPSNFNTENMHAVTVLLGPDDSMLNANTQTFQELLETEITGTKEVYRNEYAEVFPNPFGNSASLRLRLDSPSRVTMRIFNAVGAEVAYRDYGQLDGDMVFPLDASRLEDGVYQVLINLDDQIIVKKVVIQR